MLKKFISYYKPHKKLFIMDMIASFLISFSALFYPVLTRNMLNDYIPSQNLRLLILSGVVLTFIYFARMALRYFVNYYGHIMGVRMQAEMRKDLFVHLEKLPFSYYDENETGNIMTRMVSDLNDVSELAHHGPENIFISGFMIIWSFAYLCSINLYLTLIIFICVPILVSISLMLRKRMRDAFAESRKEVAVINSTLENSISGIRVTKAFTNSEKELEKFQVGNNGFVKARRKAYKAMSQFSSSTGFVTDMMNVVLLLAGGFFVYKKYINFADLTAFMLCVNLFIGPVNTLIGFMEQYQNGQTGFKRFYDIITTEVEKDDEDAVELNNVKGEIKFNNVTFRYNEKKEILHNLSINIESGEKLALVGPSGGGKTTICHLIPNFYSIESGEIIIDGIPINKIKRESLRKNIGIVQQDVFLFNGTIRENILYGNLDATEEEIIEAAKKANIHDYVMTLPDGYETNVGERGVKLSGGQKQRLSIARVFLKNPKILILDEATSALDNTTEILIQSALEKLCEGRTTIVVAHRLSTIRNADKIAVIGQGEVKEEGSHKELIEKNGIYRRLYDLQFRLDEHDFAETLDIEMS